MYNTSGMNMYRLADLIIGNGHTYSMLKVKAPFGHREYGFRWVACS